MTWDIAASNAREDEYWSQVHFPQLWVCSICGRKKNERGCCTPGNGHCWVRVTEAKS